MSFRKSYSDQYMIFHKVEAEVDVDKLAKLATSRLTKVVHGVEEIHGSGPRRLEEGPNDMENHRFYWCLPCTKGMVHWIMRRHEIIRPQYVAHSLLKM